MAGALIIVGTPIGNLGDLSPRARAALATADLIAAEDTRRTGRLLQALGIAKRPFLSVHDANEAARAERVVGEVRAGRRVTLVTDGGMPVVSDPGYRVVVAVAAAGLAIEVIPGPSAVTAALAVSGLPSDRWVFEGFVPKKAGERRRRLEAIRDETRTVVVFESPRRVRATLAAMAEVMGDRPVALCREMTKLHEEVLRGSVRELLYALGADDPKGEVVLVIGGSHGPTVPDDVAALVADAQRLVAGGARPRDAAKAVATGGTTANAVYRAMVEAAREGD